MLGERRLRFEVELFLSFGVESPLERVGCGIECGLEHLVVVRATASHLSLGADERFRPDRLVDRQYGPLLVAIDFYQLLSGGGGRPVVGGNDDHGLTTVRDFVGHQEGLVCDDGAEVIRTCQIKVAQYAADTRHVAGGGGIDGNQAPRGNGRPDEGDAQLAFAPRQVVNIGGRPGDMPGGRLVRQWPSDLWHDYAPRVVGRFVRS